MTAGSTIHVDKDGFRLGGRAVRPLIKIQTWSGEGPIYRSGHITVVNPVRRVERAVLWNERPWSNAGDVHSCIVASSCPWQKWIVKLEDLRQLKPGWNGYTAPVPSDTALRTASMFLDEMRTQGFEPTRLAPSAMGGVAITRRQGDRKGFVEFYNDGTVYALFSDRSGQMGVVQVQVDCLSFRRLIGDLRDYLHG
jgi:hypothetical protein